MEIKTPRTQTWWTLRTVSCQRASCNLPLDMGRCGEAITMYFYDKFARTCRPFSYGGAGGNYNRFPSFGDCMDRCHVVG
ncbi:kunitz-type U19-barytoxin-Tl1a-like [Dermacentor silvarum]|uniref:kunitz-type U19-barytoxin-Tl1a-like n=1 Tax=Dermacentor silvarum TaxID=543639 RepID=UPI0021013DD7|nr:kunitz-type U19-barytoxin-Tl1a-like [Dermacentor silvarum]